MWATFPHDDLATPASVGLDEAALGRAVALFRDQQAEGTFPGGQLAVRRQGRLVVDEAVGLARGFRAEERQPAVPVERTTRFAVFSAGKPVIAVAVALLEERGVLDVSSPVARYWPGFASGGKGAITVLDVLTHRTGLLTPGLVREPELWVDRERLEAALVAAKPLLRRGTLAYQPYEFGWILDAVVRRATGLGLDRFVAEELAGPAGIPGLAFGARADELGTLARAYWLGTRPVHVAGNELSATFERIQNRPDVLRAFVPGAGVVCDAADLAAFYEVLVNGGVTSRGRRLLSEETVRRYTRKHVAAIDRSNCVPLVVGRGFLLGSRGPSVYGWWETRSCFGHAGAFSTLAFGDRKTGLSVAVVTNGNRGPLESLWRFAPLSSALRKACRAG